MNEFQSLAEARWIGLSEQVPDEEQEVLTKTKDGYVSGYYDKTENTFSGYHFGREATWYASRWLPLEP